jgi:UDP-glucuronate 4-epimerase
MKILITGVAGFIGSSLAEKLLTDGHDIIGIDSFTSYYSRPLKMANLQPLTANSRFKLYEEDLATSPLSTRLKDVSVVFHQAGQPGVRKSWGKDFVDYTDWNIIGTQRLLEACKGNKNLDRIVYASSSSVYGNATKYPTSEASLPRPISPYGVTKLAGEHLMSLYGINYELPTVSLRYFTVYGPKQRPDMAFTRFVTAAQQNTEITIYGDGTQIRDFTYIDDVVNANIAAAFGPVPSNGEVYNVAGGSSVSVNEVLGSIEDIHGGPLNVRYVDRSLGDAVRTGGDVSKIKAHLGWTPRVTVREGLVHQYDWAKSQIKELSYAVAE